MSKKSKTKRPGKSQFAVKKPTVLPQGPVKNLNNMSQFNQVVINSDKPAIIDFWAEWCVPCKMTAPAFAAVAQRYGEQVNFCKVNTEKNRGVAQAYGIRSIPTLIMIFEGEVFDVHIGATNQAGIERMAKKLITKAEKEQKKISKADSVEAGGGLVGKIKGIFGNSAAKDSPADQV